jgi:hypothetical protein
LKDETVFARIQFVGSVELAKPIGFGTEFDRASLYTEITDKIIAELEAGRIPWVGPWGTAAIKAPLAMPRNAATQRGYLILWDVVIERGFSGRSWRSSASLHSLLCQSMRRSAGRGCEGRATSSILIRITFIMEYIPNVGRSIVDDFESYIWFVSLFQSGDVAVDGTVH